MYVMCSSEVSLVCLSGFAMARSVLCLVDIEAVRRLAPAEYELRRFTKITHDEPKSVIDFDDQIYEYEELGFKIRRKVFAKLWHGGWRGGYWKRKFRRNPTRRLWKTNK